MVSPCCCCEAIVKQVKLVLSCKQEHDCMLENNSHGRRYMSDWRLHALACSCPSQAPQQSCFVGDLLSALAKHHISCISSSSAIRDAQDNPIPVSSFHSSPVRNALSLSLLSKGTMMEEYRVSSLLFRHLSLSPLFKKKKNVNLGYPAVA